MYHVRKSETSLTVQQVSVCRRRLGKGVRGSATADYLPSTVHRTNEGVREYC